METFGRRHIDARGERAYANLLLLGEKACEIKLRSIGMPCVLEDAAGEREYRGLVEGRPHDFQLSLALERVAMFSPEATLRATGRWPWMKLGLVAMYLSIQPQPYFCTTRWKR